METDVDMLVSLVEQKGSISIEKAASQLKVPMATIQRWIDFLIEEEVLGIEYKFVTPYLYFNKPLKNTSLDEVEVTVEDKKEFFTKAKEKNLSTSEAKDSWLRYLNRHLTEYRKQFIAKAELKGITESKAQNLWQEYYTYLKGDEI